MVKLRIKIDVCSQGLDESGREQIRENLRDLFCQLLPRRLWYCTRGRRGAILLIAGGLLSAEFATESVKSIHFLRVAMSFNLTIKVHFSTTLTCRVMHDKPVLDRMEMVWFASESCQLSNLETEWEASQKSARPEPSRSK